MLLRLASQYSQRKSPLAIESIDDRYDRRIITDGVARTAVQPHGILETTFLISSFSGNWARISELPAIQIRSRLQSAVRAVFPPHQYW
jgi:hypothetical protein